MHMLLSATYSIWAGTWCQLRLTDILDSVLLRLGKVQRQYEYNFIEGFVDLES
jgi:hypothetical protein